MGARMFMFTSALALAACAPAVISTPTPSPMPYYPDNAIAPAIKPVETKPPVGVIKKENKKDLKNARKNLRSLQDKLTPKEE